jgi:ADP-heptose:LPS heptosyltransferase
MIARIEPSSTVVFHQAALGDFVLIWPLLRAMRGKVVIVAPWSKAKLAADVFESVEPVDIEMLEFTQLYAEGGPTHISPVIRDLFADARRIISFVSTGDDLWAQNVDRLAPHAMCCYVRPRPPTDWHQHVCVWHEAQLARQNCSLVGKSNVTATQHNGPIVIHLGSGGRHKNWPIERYQQLVETLRDRGCEVRVIVGEVEQDKWPAKLLYSMQIQPLRTLDELVGALNKASIYIGNDAGPTHLAAQLGLTTIALFGPTSPQVWAPVGPTVTTIAPPSPCHMDWLNVEQVLQIVQQPPPKAVD